MLEDLTKNKDTVTSEALLSWCHGFRESCLLITAAELDIFSLLATVPLSLDDITTRLQGNKRALQIMLDALVAMNLLDKEIKQGGNFFVYKTKKSVEGLLVADRETSILPFITHADTMLQRWAQLKDVVLHATSETQPIAPFVDPKRVESFIHAMHLEAEPLAQRLMSTIADKPVGHFLDIGGGPATYTVAFLDSHPGWQATLFDLKDTLPLSKRYLEKANLLQRTTLHEGDFYRDPLPQGIDLALLSAIIHQNSPTQNLALYRKVREALRPGGRLVIRDHVMSEEKTWPLSGALFAVNMLVCTPGGNSYSFSEIAEVLKQAGFSGIRQIANGVHMDSLIVATSP